MANIKQIVLKDAQGNVLGTYDIKDANVPHSSESAVSGGTTLSLVTTGEKYTWNNKPNSNGVLLRNTFVTSTTSYSADNMRGQTRFLYQIHGVPYTGTTVSFDSSNNENYTLQLNGSYSAGKLFFRTRYGDKSTWNTWVEVCQRNQFTAINAGSSAICYIPLPMRGAGNGQDNQYLLSCGTSAGTGGLYLLRPDTVSTQKMIITAIVNSSHITVTQVSDPWGFTVRASGYPTTPSIIKL